MNIPKCAVKNCEGNGFVLYGSNWICGDCMLKIMNKETEKKNKMVEDLEI